MKKTSVVVLGVLLFCLSGLLVLADETMKTKNHDMTVEFVSYDAKTKMVTFKDAEGHQKTAPVMDAAMKGVQTLKAGDRVTITCADNDKGEHQGVAMVKPATEKKAS